MYKIGIALMAIFAVMVIPAQGSSENGRPAYYGMGTIVLNDSFGNEIFSETIHNRVVNTGETFINTQTFQNGTSVVADNASIGAICVSQQAGFSTAEVDNATAFDSATGITSNPECKEDTVVDLSTLSKAIIGPLTFTTSNIETVGGTITGIGVCQASSGTDADFNTCGANGILFAVVDTTDVTLSSGETVQITYTFDLTSDTT